MGSCVFKERDIGKECERRKGEREAEKLIIKFEIVAIDSPGGKRNHKMNMRAQLKIVI